MSIEEVIAKTVREVVRKELAELASALRSNSVEPRRDDGYLTVSQVATMLGGLHARTVRRMLADGRLRPHRTGVGGSARVLVSRADVQALLAGQR